MRARVIRVRQSMSMSDDLRETIDPRYSRSGLRYSHCGRAMVLQWSCIDYWIPCTLGYGEPNSRHGGLCLRAFCYPTWGRGWWSESFGYPAAGRFDDRLPIAATKTGLLNRATSIHPSKPYEYAIYCTTLYFS